MIKIAEAYEVWLKIKLNFKTDMMRRHNNLTGLRTVCLEIKESRRIWNRNYGIQCQTCHKTL